MNKEETYLGLTKADIEEAIKNNRKHREFIDCIDDNDNNADNKPQDIMDILLDSVDQMRDRDYEVKKKV